MAEKKIPLRMCVGCREMKPKHELVRIVRTPEGEIKIDRTGRLNGRGAYICKEEQCLKKAAKINILSKTFGIPVGEDVYIGLKEELNAIDR